MSMIAAALIPAAPVLIPGLSGTLLPAAVPRAAAHRVLQDLISAGPDVIIVIAEGPLTREFDETSAWGLHRLGGLRGEEPAPGSAADLLPIPLAVGAAVLRDAGWRGSIDLRQIDRDAPVSEALALGRQLAGSPQRLGLVLLGNASACSTPKAPGSFHPRSTEFNLDFVTSIRTADVAAIREWSSADFAEQMSDGRLPLQVLIGAWGEGDFSTEIHFADESYGVFYVCASLTPRASAEVSAGRGE
ncbi:MAG: hypothetical protein RL205_1079 [Actinomycetota bacterium]|jgi:hypothetical protein